VGYDLKILTGNTNRALAEEICTHLDTPLGRASVNTFPGGETHVQIEENIRGSDVFIIQPVCGNVGLNLSPNDSLMELLVLTDAARRASARRITAVLPYYGYARQDRKDRPRVPITAKLVANMIYTAGARRVLSLDLHENQIQGFFDIPFDHLYSINIFTNYLSRRNIQDLVVVSPDIGNLKMTRAYADILEADLAVVDKRRTSGTDTEVMNLIGEVDGRNVVVVDDLISTGGSLVEAAAALRERGALEILACIVHPVLAGPAIERVENSVLTELVVTNSIPIPEKSQNGKIKVLSIATILGEAIRRINNDESVSTLFANAKVEG
jgi:ribose-phosphate pyrophosphokinase